MGPASGIEHVLEFPSPAETAGGRQASCWSHAAARSDGYRDGVTVRRLRPFALRRLSTRRPFFVAIRTRKPCVRFRCRRFG